ncbi:MAG: DUF4139 domain-containing protein [Polyangiaceae bacterium]
MEDALYSRLRVEGDGNFSRRAGPARTEFDASTAEILGRKWSEVFAIYGLYNPRTLVRWDSMRHISAALLPVLALALGCSSSATSYVRSPETTLGRVVVYGNGVAYFERYADVQGDALNLQVPADKVDDFLKSLTVADATTNRPEPISYPTDVPSSGTGLIDMKIQLNGARSHKLKLTYVTEAPSWKPSYRVTLGPTGKVNIQAWAIVDNTSGEDWRAVKLGVGFELGDVISVRLEARSRRRARDPQGRRLARDCASPRWRDLRKSDGAR